MPDPAPVPGEEGEPEPLPAHPRRWTTLLRWAPAVLVLVACAFLARSLDWKQIGDSFLGARLWAVGLAVVLAGLITVAHAGYWTVMVQTIAPLGLGTLTTYTFASYAANTFLPMRAGEALRVWLLQKRHHVPLTLSGALIALEKVGDTTSLLLLVTPLPWLMVDLPPSIAKALRILPLIVVGAGIAIAIGQRHARRWKFLSGFTVVERPRVIVSGFLCLLTAWVMDVVAILVVMLAVHIQPSLDKALVVILLVNIAIGIPAVPGQVGTHELGSIFALKLVGVSEAQAIPFAVLYHATQLLPVLVIGLGSARTLSKAREASTPADVAVP